ncbi:MAG: asparaginase [Synergistes sp.]|nr:asparaginase [Synergistes sp.]
MPREPKLALVIAGNFTSDEDNADPNILLNFLPEELARCCEIREWSCQPSTFYSMPMTLAMEEMFESLVAEGFTGIIAVCGSGVVEELVYFVNLLWQHSEPVIFVNLMLQGRSGLDEGLLNLRCSVLAALTPEARDSGVLLCSSGELFSADDVTLADPTSLDSAFTSPRKGSIGKMLNGEIKFFSKAERPPFLLRRPSELPRVEILWAVLGGGDKSLDYLSSERNLGGLVLAGFGSGNVPPSWMPSIRSILRREIPVAISSRCFVAHVNRTSDFEGSFECLTDMGVMSAGNLNPLKARIRMSIGLGSGLTETGLSHYLLNKSVSGDERDLYK